MADFLERMARRSRERCEQARARLPEEELRRRIVDAPPPARLRLDGSGFDLIAEFKPASPTRGVLADGPATLTQRVEAYARGGATAVSVLTEPSVFGGSLEQLAAAAATGLAAMRKDFPVDPYQLVEARAHGASGVLVIARLIDDEVLGRMLAAASELGLFVLLECFDRADLHRCERLTADHRPPDLLVGVNARDLRTLSCEPARFARLASDGPAGVPRVAESGIAVPTDAAEVARLGYRLALVGTSLMRSVDPEDLVRSLLAAGRAARREVRSAS